MKYTKRPEIAFLLDIFRPYKLHLFVLILLNALVGVTSLMYPYFVKLQTDQLQKAHTDLFQMISGSPLAIFLIILALVVLSSGIQELLQFFSRLLNQRIREKLTIRAEEHFFTKLEHLDSGFLTNPRNRRITSSVYSISYIFQRAFSLVPENFRRLLTFAGVVPIILVIDYKIGIFALTMSLVDYLFYKRKIYQENQIMLASDNLRQKMYELNYLLLFNFQKILLIDQGNKILENYREKQLKNYKVENIRFRNTEKWQGIFWLMENVTSTLIAIVFGYQVLTGKFSLGDFTMITLYVLQLKSGISSFLSSVNEWRSLELDFLKLGFFINLKPKFQLEHPLYAGDLHGDIVFKNVFFRYPSLDENEREYTNFLMKRQNIHKDKLKFYHYDESEFEGWKTFLEESSKPNPLVLEDFSFHLKKNSITALLGRNGSGKTTYTNLLLRLYDAELGEITVNSIPMKQIDPTHLRKFVSVLTQENFLVDAFSIRDNVLMGVNRAVTDQEIEVLMERLMFLDKIRSLPKGLDSIMGDDIQLSGGQRQLLSIIRVYLQARPIIIFDEGTNQLDAEHEVLVMNFLQQMKSQSTILMITHKLTSARRADQIYVLDQGKIIEFGTHLELLKKDGFYHKFWKLQVID